MTLKTIVSGVPMPSASCARLHRLENAAAGHPVSPGSCEAMSAVRMFCMKEFPVQARTTRLRATRCLNGSSATTMVSGVNPPRHGKEFGHETIAGRGATPIVALGF